MADLLNNFIKDLKGGISTVQENPSVLRDISTQKEQSVQLGNISFPPFQSVWVLVVLIGVIYYIRSTKKQSEQSQFKKIALDVLIGGILGDFIGLGTFLLSTPVAIAFQFCDTFDAGCRLVGLQYTTVLYVFFNMIALLVLLKKHKSDANQRKRVIEFAIYTLIGLSLVQIYVAYVSVLAR